jgi:hypothetical protein
VKSLKKHGVFELNRVRQRWRTVADSGVPFLSNSALSERFQSNTPTGDMNATMSLAIDSNSYEESDRPTFTDMPGPVR